MATKELTERQQEIVALQREGKTAPKIAEALGITENAVYQHLRRIREATHGKPARKAGASSRTAAPKPAAAPATVSPEQALKTRRSDIEAEIKAHGREVESARAALAKLEKDATTRVESLNGELKRVLDAQAALTGQPRRRAAPKRASRARARGKTTPKPATQKPQEGAANGAASNVTPMPTPKSAAPAAS